MSKKDMPTAPQERLTIKGKEAEAVLSEIATGLSKQPEISFIVTIEKEAQDIKKRVASFSDFAEIEGGAYNSLQEINDHMDFLRDRNT